MSADFVRSRLLCSAHRCRVPARSKQLMLLFAAPLLAAHVLSQEPQLGAPDPLLRQAAPLPILQGTNSDHGGISDLDASVGQLGSLPMTLQPARTVQAALIRPFKLTTCQLKVLMAVNSRFPATHLTPANVAPTSSAERRGNEANVNFTGTAEQFASLSSGRYAPRRPLLIALLIGYGPSLHIVKRPTLLDRTALRFSRTAFTAHLDSAWADTPIGTVLHFLIDVLRPKARNPCP